MAEAPGAGQMVAVLGLGSMGLRHASNAVALGADTVGIDLSPDCREAARATVPELTVAGEEATEEVLAAADSVIVATPSSRHLANLRMAIQADCHVLVEKPISDSTIGLGEDLRSAQEKGLVVAVAQNLRFHPSVVAARDRIQDGRFGPVLSAVSIGASYLPDWRPGQDYRKNYAADAVSGGVIFDWVHEIDMLAYLLGPFLVEGAAAAGQRVLDMPSEEEAGLLLRHDGGALSTLMLSYTVRPPLRTTWLMGPDGRMEIDIPGRRLTRMDVSGRVVEDIEFGGRHEDDYRAELWDFFHAIGSGAVPRCSAAEAFDVIRGALDARRTAGLPGRDA